MLFWALLNLRVLLRAPAKRAMRGRAVHARSPIDAALSSTDATKNTGERCLLVSYMTLAQKPGGGLKKKPLRYAKTTLIENDRAAPTHSCSESHRSVAAPSLHEQLRGW